MGIPRRAFAFAFSLVLLACQPKPAVVAARPPVARATTKSTERCPLPKDERSASREEMIGVPVESVCFRGYARVTEAALSGALDTKVGRPFHPETIRQDLQNLFGLGSVDDVEVHAARTPRGVVLAYTIHERSRLHVQVVGATSLSPEERQEATKVGEWMDPARIRATAEALAEACQKHGKRATRVTFEVTPVGEGSNVTFTVEEGP
jgi:outer membrane protein assembly factor BamA